MRKIIPIIFLVGTAFHFAAQAARGKGESEWICGEGPTAIRAHFYKDTKGNVVLGYGSGVGEKAGSAVFHLDGVQRDFDGLMVPGPTPGSTIDISKYVAYRMSTIPAGSPESVLNEMVLIQLTLMDAGGKIAMILNFGISTTGLDYNEALTDATRIFRPGQSHSCERVP